MAAITRAIITAAALVAVAAAEAPAGEAGALVGTRLNVPLAYATGAFKEKRTLHAPPGFSISVFAAGMDGARFMATDGRGVIYVTVPSRGEVVALPDADGDGVADSAVVFAGGLDSPHGIVYRDGGFIVAETGSLVFLRDTDGDLLADEKRTLTDDIPPGGGHWTRTVVEGPGGSLYVSAGSSCNVCIEQDKRRATVMRFAPPYKKGAIFATGLRNSVGMAAHPGTKELWAVDNGRDWLGDDLPPEELNRVEEGKDYGWPYCYADRTPDPDYGTPERCANSTPPVVKMQAHSAPLGMAFGRGLKFPEPYAQSLYIAFHGSWNRSVPTGYKLVRIDFVDGKPAGEPVDFITGWLVSAKRWGRPVFPLVGADGALYLSDDYAGAVYRITYGK